MQITHVEINQTEMALVVFKELLQVEYTRSAYKLIVHIINL